MRVPPFEGVSFDVQNWLRAAERRLKGRKRPLVSLCYAQSLEGSLTAQRGRPTALSGPESLRLTHYLRTLHGAILVGSGTVLADDPQLTVRLVAGPHPQPIILDGRLRTPPQARVLRDHPRSAWIATRQDADPQRCAALEAAGARLLFLPCDENGYLDLKVLLNHLAEQGIARLMVEGGAQVITSFLQRNLVDVACVTLAPLFLGGLPLLTSPLPQPLRLEEVHVERCGGDLVLFGYLT